MNYYKLYIFTFVLLFSNILSAQPILTQNNTAPQANQNFTITNINFINPGSSGANQTWDFSTASSMGASSINVFDASSTQNGNNFPSSNIAISQDGVLSYYEINSNVWNYFGLHTTLSVSYSNPQAVLSFPFTYSNQITDSFYCVFNVGYNIFKRGLALIEADGYGNLILPSGTYTNVLRVHYIINTKDSSQNGVSNYTQEYYYWFKEWNHNPVAYMMVTPTQSGYYLNNIFTGINEYETIFDIYPNPCSDILILNINNSALENIQLRIYDLSGKEILFKNMLPGENNKTIDISTLSCGTYILCMYSSNKVIETKKIIVK